MNFGFLYGFVHKIRNAISYQNYEIFKIPLRGTDCRSKMKKIALRNLRTKPDTFFSIKKI